MERELPRMEDIQANTANMFQFQLCFKWNERRTQELFVDPGMWSFSTPATDSAGRGGG